MRKIQIPYAMYMKNIVKRLIRENLHAHLISPKEKLKLATSVLIVTSIEKPVPDCIIHTSFLVDSDAHLSLIFVTKADRAKGSLNIKLLKVSHIEKGLCMHIYTRFSFTYL